ncbi:hypothetical protein ASG87_01135 [Frateuria sp. Soil773]|uniref:hypothetical protein n=1 Tax=Frateuria sp. Soil773 TaxID=1736407 RepID=UPI0006F4528F|nr:hypothetical protein [Frateuria sp. Soil773]KRE90768.1 hypothetical protein ASG87_01135 [Frateuria sp. Soil773]
MQVEHHRWDRSGADAHAQRGLAPLDPATRALLHELRWRRPARDPWRMRWATVLVLLLHGLFVAVLWLAMRPSPPREAATRQGAALQVRLIEAPRRTAAPAPPVPEPSAPPANPRPRPAPSREPVSAQAMVASVPGPAPAPEAAPRPRLYDRDGQPLLPAAAASAPGVPGYVQRRPQGDMQVMRHDHPVTYTATRFEQYFPPPNETAGQAVVRHVVEKVSKPFAVRLPRGVHLRCTLLTGCADPPAAPPKKDGDERLSMAPAAPLAKELAPAGGPDLAECIAIYREGKPLPHGCPVDTPNRAVDAECTERTAKSAAAHCAGRATPGPSAVPAGGG